MKGRGGQDTPGTGTFLKKPPCDTPGFSEGPQRLQ